MKEEDRNRVRRMLDEAKQLEDKNHLINESKKIEDEIAKKHPEAEKKQSEAAALAKEEKIKELQNHVDSLKKALESDVRLQELKKKNEELMKSLKVEERQCIDMNYTAFELEHLQQLSSKQKDLEADNRRSLQADYEQFKQILEDTIKNNRAKVDRKIRENEPIEIKNKEAELQRQQKEFTEMKKRHDDLREKVKEMALEQAKARQVVNGLSTDDEK